MRHSEGASPLTVAVVLSAYLGGIITVAVISCDDVWLPGETEYTNASPSFDGGSDKSPDLSVLAFVFLSNTEGIVDVAASVYEDGKEVKLNGVSLYRMGNTLVVEVKAEMRMGLLPHFRFLNHNGEVVKEYLAYVYVDQSLITCNKEVFSEDFQFAYYNQLDEIEAEIGDCFDITLENENRVWVNGAFHTLWKVVRLPAGSYIASPAKLVEVDQPSIVGIAGGIKGETVSLEVFSE